MSSSTLPNRLELYWRLVRLHRPIGILLLLWPTLWALMVAAHGALFADRSFGGLALGLTEIDCEWDAEDADAGVAALPARYEIRYRTLATDLTRTGETP